MIAPKLLSQLNSEQILVIVPFFKKYYSTTLNVNPSTRPDYWTDYNCMHRAVLALNPTLVFRNANQILLDLIKDWRTKMVQYKSEQDILNYLEKLEDTHRQNANKMDIDGPNIAKDPAREEEAEQEEEALDGSNNASSIGADIHVLLDEKKPAILINGIHFQPTRSRFSIQLSNIARRAHSCLNNRQAIGLRGIDTDKQSQIIVETIDSSAVSHFFLMTLNSTEFMKHIGRAEKTYRFTTACINWDVPLTRLAKDPFNNKNTAPSSEKGNFSNGKRPTLFPQKNRHDQETYVVVRPDSYPPFFHSSAGMSNSTTPSLILPPPPPLSSTAFASQSSPRNEALRQQRKRPHPETLNPKTFNEEPPLKKPHADTTTNQPRHVDHEKPQARQSCTNETEATLTYYVIAKTRLQKEVTTLESTLRQREQEAAIQNETLQAKDRQIAELQQQVAAFGAANQQSFDTATRLTTESKEFQPRIKALENKINSQSIKIARRAEYIEQQKRAQKSTENELSQAEETINRLELQIKNLMTEQQAEKEEELAAMEEIIVERDAQIARLKQQEIALRAQITQLQQTLQTPTALPALFGENRHTLYGSMRSSSPAPTLNPSLDDDDGVLNFFQ